MLDSLGKNRESKYDYQRDVCHAIDDRFFGPETDYSLEKRQNYMQLRAMGMTPDQPIQGRFVYKLSLPLYFIFLDNCFFASSLSIHFCHLFAFCASCSGVLIFFGFLFVIV